MGYGELPSSQWLMKDLILLDRRHCRAIVKSTCAHRVEWLKGAIRNK